MLKVAAMGLIAALLAIQFRSIKPEYSVYISVAVCLLLFSFGLQKVSDMIQIIQKIQSIIHWDTLYFQILMKMIGIAYLCEFSGALCKDLGYSAIAGQIEWIGKLTILLLSTPVFMALLETVNQFLGGI